MMKSTIKKFLLTTIGATMLMSTMAFADITTDSAITTGSAVNAPIYYNDVTEVVVPTSLAVAANPQGYTATIVSGRTITLLFINLKTLAMAIAPNATCDSPSPINEYRLRTSVTPKSDADNDITTATTKA